MDNLIISNKVARRFLVAYHGLDRYSKLGKEQAILDYFRKVGSIQFDPLDICGKNAELVLQSRIRDFKPAALYKLLYKKRKLFEGWDKMMCIYNMSDYPFFKRRRDRDKSYFESDNCTDIREISGDILTEIANRGPLSSLDLDFHEKRDWSWAPAKMSRASLEMLFFSGKLGIDSRVHSRRKYDLVENVVPTDLLALDDPNISEAEHTDWRVKRRIGSLGFYHDKSGDGWLGMMKKSERDDSIRRLVEQEQLILFKISGLDHNFYMCREDEELLNAIVSGKRKITKKISFLAPLDNFMWDRRLIEMLFDFKYRWEVYKPVKDREYGYYVLPVLYGDRIIARFEPVRDKKQGKLIIKNWWWQENIKKTDPMKKAILKAVDDFAAFLEVEADHRISFY